MKNNMLFLAKFAQLAKDLRRSWLLSDETRSRDHFWDQNGLDSGLETSIDTKMSHSALTKSLSGHTMTEAEAAKSYSVLLSKCLLDLGVKH